MLHDAYLYNSVARRVYSVDHACCSFCSPPSRKVQDTKTCANAAKLYHAACSEWHTQYTHYKDNVLSVAEELETKTCLTTCSFFCKIVNYTGFMVFTCGNIFKWTIVVFVCALLNGALVHSPPLSQLIISHVKWRRCDKIQQAWVAGENWQKENPYLRVQYWNNMVTFCGPAFFLLL